MEADRTDGASGQRKRKVDTPSTSSQPCHKRHRCDKMIIKVSEAISNDSDLRKLGLELGVENPAIDRALATNWATGVKTSSGNLEMLKSWAETVKQSEQIPTLRAALENSGLVHVAETCLQSCPDNPTGMPDEILKLKEKLKARYRKKFSEVKTSPVDSASRTWLQHIYVSLVLMLGLTGEKEKEKEIDFEGLFEKIKTETPRGFETRFAFLGEAGAGKSTLFAKIAFDWAEGRILQEIDLLFLESFREIEEHIYFGDIVMNHFPDDMDTKGEQVDKYIRENQRKVLILLDGLDEAKIDIRRPNCDDAVVSMIRGEKFTDTPILITTRPFGADQIKGIMEVNEQYTYIKVKGFSEENMSTYIKQYFRDDPESASSLVTFMKTNRVVAKHMAPFPIFCCMLCYMWKEPSGRETIQAIKTFPQLLGRLVFSLQEHYSCKHDEGDYSMNMEKADESMKDLSCVAFHGLLSKQLIFDEESMRSCIRAAMTACEVGILSKEETLAPLKIRQRERKRFIQEFSFPHKLLQEYIASSYLVSLFYQDRPEFDRILTDKLLKDYGEFGFVFCFTAAHGGEVGKRVMEALCEEVDDMDFIIRVAYECHDREAIDPARNRLKMLTDLKLTSYFDLFASYLFTLATLGEKVERECSLVAAEKLVVGKSIKDHTLAAIGLCSLQDLRSLTMKDQHAFLDDDFYTGMSAAASLSKIQELRHEGPFLEPIELDPTASYHYAIGLCSMPNLRSLTLMRVKPSDEFFSTMASEASKSKIQELKHDYGRLIKLGPTASRHYARGLFSIPDLQSLNLANVMPSIKFFWTMVSEASKSKIQELKYEADRMLPSKLDPLESCLYAVGLFSMPNLRSLTLTRLMPSEEFFSVMASLASKSKIQELKHKGSFILPIELGRTASYHYAIGLCSMPNLRSLELDRVMPSDEFFSAMASEASKSKIQELKHDYGGLIELGPTASRHYARGLFSMPDLQSLNLANVMPSDEFFSTMASEASKSKIQELKHEALDGRHFELGPTASYHYAIGLCSMPNLRSLNLGSVKPSDEFFSTVASEASKSKIQELKHEAHLVPIELGPTASYHYAISIFSMPNLRSLKLVCVELSDEFFSTMASEASKSKIQTLVMDGMSMITRRILHAILSLPCLLSLSLTSIVDVHMDDGETLDTCRTASVNELSLDDRHVTSLWKLGLHTSCPRVNKLTLRWSPNEVIADIVKALPPLQDLTHLHIKGDWSTELVIGSSSFCSAVITSCPRLTKLSLACIRLYNKDASKIIQSMKTHPHLTNIELDDCYTTEDLDPLIARVNSEGKLTVTVKHGPSPCWEE